VTCQKEDWSSFHKHKECKFYRKILTTEDQHREEFKSSLHAPYDTMLRLYLMIKAKPEVVSQKYTMFNGTERSFADLMQDDGQLKKREKAVGFSIALFYQIDPTFMNSMEEVDLMREVYHKIRINSHFIQGNELVPIGHGLSIETSALNHSCRPNLGVNFKGNKQEMRAMRDIAFGEEVTTNYIDQNFPKEVRHQQLAINWEFICKCQRCEAGDTPEELEGLKKMNEVNQYIASLPEAVRGAVMFDKMMEVLPIREKLQGPYNLALTHDMLLSAENRFFAKRTFSEKDKENMLMLMEKIMTAWPITHGADHWKYPDVLRLNEEVNRKFGKKK
jgi:hypothetical protein